MRTAQSADYFVYNKVGNGTSGQTPDGYAGPLTLINQRSAGINAAGGYYLDAGSGLLRKIISSAGNVATIAGGGKNYSNQISYGSPAPAKSVALSNAIAGIVHDTSFAYFADASLVYKYSLSTGDIDILAGSSTVTGDVDSSDGQDARFAYNSTSGVGISDLAIDDLYEYLYVCDRGNNKIKTIKLTSPFEVTTVVGTGQTSRSGVTHGWAFRQDLNDPVGLAFASPYLYITEHIGNRVMRFDTSSQFIDLFAGLETGVADSSGDGGDATSAALSGP